MNISTYSKKKMVEFPGSDEHFFFVFSFDTKPTSSEGSDVHLRDLYGRSRPVSCGRRVLGWFDFLGISVKPFHGDEGLLCVDKSVKKCHDVVLVIASFQSSCHLF